jgi:hypothetical protein
MYNFITYVKYPADFTKKKTVHISCNWPSFRAVMRYSQLHNFIIIKIFNIHSASDSFSLIGEKMQKHFGLKVKQRVFHTFCTNCTVKPPLT